MARHGGIIDRSTLSFWMDCAVAAVAPVVTRLREMMLASTRIFADEIVVPVLDPGREHSLQITSDNLISTHRPRQSNARPALSPSYSLHSWDSQTGMV